MLRVRTRRPAFGVRSTAAVRGPHRSQYPDARTALACCFPAASQLHEPCVARRPPRVEERRLSGASGAVTGRTRSAGATAGAKPPSAQGEDVSHPFPRHFLRGEPHCWQFAGSLQTPWHRLEGKPGTSGRSRSTLVAAVVFAQCKFCSRPAKPHLGSSHLEETCPLALPTPSPHPPWISRDRNIHYSDREGVEDGASFSLDSWDEAVLLKAG